MEVLDYVQPSERLDVDLEIVVPEPEPEPEEDLAPAPAPEAELPPPYLDPTTQHRPPVLLSNSAPFSYPAPIVLGS